MGISEVEMLGWHRPGAKAESKATLWPGVKYPSQAKFRSCLPYLSVTYITDPDKRKRCFARRLCFDDLIADGISHEVGR